MASNAPALTLVTERPGENPNNTEIIAVKPIVLILIRSARTFLQVFVGALGVSAVTSIFPTGDFQAAVVRAAGIAGASAFVSLCQNAGELLAAWDRNLPLIRG